MTDTPEIASRTITQCPKFDWCVMGYNHRGGCSSTPYTLVSTDDDDPLKGLRGPSETINAQDTEIASLRQQLAEREGQLAAALETLTTITEMLTTDPDALRQVAEAFLSNPAAAGEAWKRRVQAEALRWVPVKTRADLPPSTTRVWMFVRGVGLRMGTSTSLFELPWCVTDPDWMGDPCLPLDAVIAYINLDALAWPTIESGAAETKGEQE